ncbi:probable protein TIC 62, chloroplastic [Coccomyxa sp. Obi]|nr:probable protein TIC 62, chloroplastic [Coccomyxa sp. Obi]
MQRGYKVRALTRSAEKAAQLLGEKDGLEIAVADARDASTLTPVTEGISAVAAVTGTTAFPSKRWDGNNGPEQTDYVAMKNLIEATPKSVKRFVLTTSAGVDRSNQLPFNILNLFGVLKYKKASELLLQQSGLPWTIVRPGRLTDGPYTSYDLNTLLQATAGTRQDIQVSLKDDQSGETSRIAVAEAIVQILALEEAEGKAYAITSKEGDGPGTDSARWRALLA